MYFWYGLYRGVATGGTVSSLGLSLAYTKNLIGSSKKYISLYITIDVLNCLCVLFFIFKKISLNPSNSLSPLFSWSSERSYWNKYTLSASNWLASWLFLRDLLCPLNIPLPGLPCKSTESNCIMPISFILWLAKSFFILSFLWARAFWHRWAFLWKTKYR